MWSEEFDKKIKDAAEHDATAFNEKAWDTMLPLLDQHLPREKKRRWAFLWFFGLLISATAIFFIVQNKTGRTLSIAKKQATNQDGTKEQINSENKINSQDNLIKKQESTLTPSTTEKNNNPDNILKTETAGDDNLLSESRQKNREEIVAPQDKSGTSKLPAANINKNDQVALKKDSRKSNQTKQDYTGGNDQDLTIVQRSPKKQAVSPLKTNQDKLSKGTVPDGNNDIAANKNSSDDQIKNTSSKNDPAIVDKQSMVPKPDSLATTQTAKSPDLKANPIVDSTDVKADPIVKKKQAPGNKGGKFSILLSAGPDISAVSENIGKLKMQYGIGIGYAINDRFTVRTGFYISRKVYTADSADYHPPKTFWTYFDNLQSIDANCLVYEIPLNVVYNFPSGKKDNWFVSGGVSSYLMKKETYGYSYKNSWNQPEYYSRTYKNENNHFFSVLSISGGYRHQLSQRFSLMAEPYLKMPLSGVGFGKVKLNSGGIILTAAFKPFLKRK